LLTEKLHFANGHLRELQYPPKKLRPVNAMAVLQRKHADCAPQNAKPSDAIGNMRAVSGQA
jgi:hypothetical protein